MLRWLRSPQRAEGLARLTLILALLAALLVDLLPGTAEAAPPRQGTTPLQFVDGVAVQAGFATNNQPLVYTFFGTQGENVVIELTTQAPGINFEFTGDNNQVYKSLSNPARTFQFDLPLSQTYRITVFNSSPVGAIFTLTVTRSSGGGGQPQRINFAPGQTQAQVSGNAGPGLSPQYIFTVPGGQQIRILLISPGNLANFSLRGFSDNMIYKQPTDQARDWTSPPLPAQDYVITVTAPQAVGFTLQINLLNTPGPAERINLLPGQSTAVLNGNLPAGSTKYYVIFAAAGQQLRLLLTSNPAGSINFAVDGNSDRRVYKSLNDPAREITIPITVSQDYLITLVNFGSGLATYQLELTLSIPTPITITPTPLPTLPSGCTSNTIQNGGFETDGFWVFGDSPVPPAYTSTTVRSGLRAVRLGIDPALGAGPQNHKAFSSVRQPFQIPIEASIAQLRWWNFYRTEEAQTDSPGMGQDKQEVILLKSDLSTVAVLRSVRRNNNAWIEELVDLTPYRGQSLVLYFNVYNDGNGQRTWQFLDDVVINVCYPEVTPTPFVPTPIPTPIPPTAVATPLPATLVLPTPVFATPGGTPLAAATALSDPAAAGATSIAATEMAGMNPLAVTAVAGSTPGSLPGATGIGVNGEPEVVVLPPGEAAQAGIAAANQTGSVQSGNTVVVIIPTTAPAAGQIAAAAANETGVRSEEGWRIFDRPAGEVFTWAGIMLGALAVIGILVALIWQASNRNGSTP